MKLNEFLSKVLAPVFTKTEDLELFTAASAFREVDVPDDLVNNFSKVYLTRDSAANDPELVKKFQREARGFVFGSVDVKLKPLLQFLDEDKRAAIEAETDTLKKIELINSAIPSLRAGGADEDKIKQLSEAARKKEKELHDQNAQLQDKIKNLETTFESKLKDAKLEYNLRTKLAGFELAPEFSDETRRNFLAESTINKLKQQFKLELDEQNPSVIHLRQEIDGIAKDVYEGNEKVTLEKVLAKEYEPFVKKSNAGNPPKPTPQPLNDKPDLKTGASLREMRAAVAE